MVAFGLCVIGYILYFGTLFAIRLDNGSESSRFVSASVVAFALSSSEFFRWPTWSLNSSILRRIIASTTLTLLCLVAAHLICAEIFNARNIVLKVVMAAIGFVAMWFFLRGRYGEAQPQTPLPTPRKNWT